MTLESAQLQFCNFCVCNRGLAKVWLYRGDIDELMSRDSGDYLAPEPSPVLRISEEGG